MRLIFGIILGGLLYFAYDRGYVDKFLSELNFGSVDEFLSEFVLTTVKISDMSCDDIASAAKGEKLKNMLGMTFKIMKVKKIRQISRTKQNIVCSGQAMFDDAQNRNIKMEVFKDEDGDVFYKFEVS